MLISSQYLAARRNVTFLPWPPIASRTWSPPPVRGALVAFSTCECVPCSVTGGSSRRVIRLMISKCSPRMASRSFVSGKGTPKAVASLTLNPHPRPRTSRPPLMVSRDAAIFAVMAGLRSVELMTPNPMSTRGTRAAIAVWIVTQSNTIASASHFASTCSPVHRESKPRRSPRRATSTIRSQAALGVQPSNSLK